MIAELGAVPAGNETRIIFSRSASLCALSFSFAPEDGSMARLAFPAKLPVLGSRGSRHNPIFTARVLSTFPRPRLQGRQEGTSGRLLGGTLDGYQESRTMWSPV